MKAVFINEPRGESYNKILDLAFAYTEEFSLTRYSGVVTDEKLSNCLGKELMKYCIDTVEVKQWSNESTEWWNEKKWYFEVNEKTKEIIKKYSTSLYSWPGNRQLEDLCFYKKGRKGWVVSITHEHFAGVYECTEKELQSIKCIEGLKLDEFR